MILGIWHQAHGVAREVSIGVGAVRASSDAATALSLHGLGSCVGIALHDRHAAVAAVAHVFHPTRETIEGARRGPWASADMAVPRLIDLFEGYGGCQQRCKVYLVGGATRTAQGIGRLNVASVRAHLPPSLTAGVILDRMGQDKWVSLKVSVGTGKVLVNSPEGRWESA